ncbi:VPA1269 family protein [Azonexus sp. IMCC34839]|uniref:VPA1269 family protein n=1 Tax=Azonexus sp. IMCC34839 TaxID=3133695 RepID=UPI00399AA68B
MNAITEFDTFGNGKVWLNMSERHQVLRLPSQEELSDLYKEFRRRQWEWFVEHMLSVSDGGQQIFGLGVTRVKAQTPDSSGNSRWVANTHRISLDAIPEEAWSLLAHVAPLPHSTASTKLFNTTIEEQRTFLRSAMGDCLESAENILRAEYKECLIYPWLASSFETQKNPAEFIDSVIKRAEFERLVAREKRKTWLRKPLPDLFLLWLAQHGVVLFPVTAQPIIGEARGFEEKLVSPDVLATWKVIESAYEATAKNLHRKWMPRIKSVFRIVTTASTLRTAEDIGIEFFNALYALMDCRLDVTLTDRLHKIYRPLRDSLGRRELPTFKPIRSALCLRDTPFHWTYLSTKNNPQRVFPRLLSVVYNPIPNVCAWGDRFARYIAKLPIKSIGNSVSTCQRFLVWLIESKTLVSVLNDLKREHINDGKSLASSQSFRAHLFRSGMKPETANGHILRLAWTFEAIIEEDRLGIGNPVSIRFDSFKVTAPRGKTPRRPMARELLVYLQQLNRENEYSLSRTYSRNQRQALSSNGQYEPIWFPGFAVIVDLLLQLPLRGFQARYLDSGEGDEFIVNLSGALELEPNLLSTATAGRRESVFYAFEATNSSPTLGIHVNTNKTSLDRVSGYEIPWCSPELKKSLSLLRDWQIKNNPVARPICCMEKHEFEQTRNQDVIEQLKTTYALFRDPSDAKGWPISRDKLFDYWSYLLATAEDRLASEGTNIKLTEEKEVSKGPNKKRITKRIAAYDIHTLRVSGISALLEAGMPPDLVQDVAGHATIVMTLYYNKIKASRLNATLAQAQDTLARNLDSIDGASEAEFERLSEFLLNTRAPEDNAGHSLLGLRKGHGDGAVEVSVHGICPGGECATGGEFQNQAVGYAPVQRPLACSLCRYRLTGPMFLPGLVLNANRLMHELRSKGKEIAEMNQELARLADKGKSTHVIKAKIEELYRETDTVSAEWAAEVQYVQLAEKMFDRFITGLDPTIDTVPALISGMDEPSLQSHLTRQSEFGLLQSLAEGAYVWSGFKPSAAITEHREFLNELLSASELEPFLLKLRGDLRDKAAVLLGRMVVSLIPDERIDNLRSGSESLADYPTAKSLLENLRRQAVIMKSIDEHSLIIQDLPPL